MYADIRLPIGLLFALVGAIITVFGFATNGADMYKHSLGININIWSGAFLTAFGIIMLIMALSVGKKGKTGRSTMEKQR